MLYLNSLASYVAPRTRALTDIATELGMSQPDVSLFRTVFGLRQIACADDEGVFGLLDNTIERLITDESVDVKQIKYIFHCHAAPCVSPPGTRLIERLQNKHGMRHAISAGIAQDQCATPLTALRFVDILLAGEDDETKVLLLTGEVASHPTHRVIPNTTIVGDAAAACLVGKTGSRNAVLSVAQRKFVHATIQPAGALMPVPETAYGDDLLQVVRDALARASLSMESIALILVHNVNSISWKFFAKNFPCPPQIVYLDNVPKMGHCYTSDPFVNYCDALQEGRIKVNDFFMMISVGMTSTFAAVVVRH